MNPDLLRLRKCLSDENITIFHTPAGVWSDGNISALTEEGIDVLIRIMNKDIWFDGVDIDPEEDAPVIPVNRIRKFK